jgi:hypothetical protein
MGQGPGRDPVCARCAFTCGWAERLAHFTKAQISGRASRQERCKACTTPPFRGYSRAAPRGEQTVEQRLEEQQPEEPRAEEAQPEEEQPEELGAGSPAGPRRSRSRSRSPSPSPRISPAALPLPTPQSQWIEEELPMLTGGEHASRERGSGCGAGNGARKCAP